MINKNIFSKRAVCAVTAIAAVFAAGCSTPATIGKIDGNDIPAGVYILAQEDAVTAMTDIFLKEHPDYDTSGDAPDYTAYTYEDKPFKDWMNGAAEEKLREYYAVDKMYEEAGLKLSQDDIKQISDTVNTNWEQTNQTLQQYYGVDNFGDYYTPKGVSKASYRYVYTNSVEKTQLFTSIYGSDGSEPVPDADLYNLMAEKYLRLRMIEIPLLDDDGNELTDADAIAEKKTLAQSYVDELKAGALFSAVLQEYEDLSSEEEEPVDEIDEPTDNASDDEPEEIDENDNDYLVSIDGESPNAAVVAAAKTAAFGEPLLVSDDDGFYVVVRLDIKERTDSFEQARASLLKEYKDPEFTERIKAFGAGLNLTINDSAISAYPPEKAMQ